MWSNLTTNLKFQSPLSWYLVTCSLLFSIELISSNILYDLYFYYLFIVFILFIVSHICKHDCPLKLGFVCFCIISKHQEHYAWHRIGTQSIFIGWMNECFWGDRSKIAEAEITRICMEEYKIKSSRNLNKDTLKSFARY